ncbi:cytochrome P450 [Rhodocollybia butyracea]|uniref:Cytochrome P450 n=1 Tax=Rhodocollybia butyracea TaxID=206335 RepID=A0A9P5Q6N7_9AGAR|nr:cytochrome P450 [Rhodocollybia butyracea]
MGALMFPLPQWLLVIATIFLGYMIYRVLLSHRKKYPPGPDPAFLIGNILQVPSTFPEEKFSEWFHKYGDVVYLRILQQPVLVLSSMEAVQDLLDTRSSIYSDRPNFVLLNDLMGWQNASTHARYGPRFRKHRRFIHQTFNQQAVRTLRPIQEKETCCLIQNLIARPHDVSQHLQRFAAATIMKITYGTDVISNDDPLVQLALRAGKLTIQSGTPAATLVDYIPALKYIPSWAPLAGFKRNAAIVKETVDSMFNIPYEMVKNQVLSGNVVPCLTSRLIETCSPAGVESLTEEDEEDIKGVAGTMFSAAEDTTVSVLSTFVLAMVLHPEVFKQAQAEMDAVVGTNRLPVFEDRASLPYLECVIKEACRWNAPVPLGLPHRLMQDDIYRGFHIPKGTTIMANIYSILQNYTQPHLFCPKRYLDDPDLLDPRDVIFGFGRRRCPGRYFADYSIWIAVATMVSTVDILKAKDNQGNEITPEVAFAPGFVRHPQHFPCCVKPRSDNVSTIVDRSLVDLLKNID